MKQSKISSASDWLEMVGRGDDPVGTKEASQKNWKLRSDVSFLVSSPPIMPGADQPSSLGPLGLVYDCGQVEGRGAHQRGCSSNGTDPRDTQHGLTYELRTHMLFSEICLLSTACALFLN